MKNTENTNNSFHNMWQFIEEYLPNYSSRDDVLQDDILFRYIDDDDVCDEDLLWIKTEFHGDKNLVKKELVRLETGFIAESINAYYRRQFDF